MLKKDRKAAIRAVDAAANLMHIIAVHAMYCPTCPKTESKREEGREP